MNQNKSWLEKLGDLSYPLYGRDFDESRGDKLIIFGFPKSGNVWLRSLVADCFNTQNINIYEHGNHGGASMCHSPDGLTLESRKDISHACYLMRDFRDVIVSYYHYSKTKDYYEKVDSSCSFTNIEDFYFDYFLSTIMERYNLFEMAEFFVSKGLPLVKYENLYDNTFSELTKLFDCWGVNISSDKIDFSISNNSLSVLKKSGKKIKDRFIPTSHFRKGGYGNWKDELPKLVVDDINKRFGSYLKRWEYLIE